MVIIKKITNKETGKTARVYFSGGGYSVDVKVGKRYFTVETLVGNPERAKAKAIEVAEKLVEQK